MAGLCAAMKSWVSNMSKITLTNGKTVVKPFNKIWIIVAVVALLLYVFSLFIPFNSSFVGYLS